MTGADTVIAPYAAVRVGLVASYAVLDEIAVNS